MRTGSGAACCCGDRGDCGDDVEGCAAQPPSMSNANAQIRSDELGDCIDEAYRKSNNASLDIVYHGNGRAMASGDFVCYVFGDRSNRMRPSHRDPPIRADPFVAQAIATSASISTGMI